MPAVSLSPVFGAGYQSFLPTGLPNNAGTITTFQAGTTTPISTYTTNAGTTANANPIVLGADGRPPQPIWLDNSLAYKFVLQDALGNTISTIDNIYPTGSVLSLQNSLAFNATKAIPGLMFRPDGVIEQWGFVVVPSGSQVTLALPQAFPNGTLDLQTSISGSVGAATPLGCGGTFVGLNQITITCYGAQAITVRWHVWGY